MILFLSAWFPSRLDSTEGLFVRKHAQALALRCEVEVLYVVGDTNIADYEVTDEEVGGVREITIYYPYRKGSCWCKVVKQWKYLKGYIIGVRRVARPKHIVANVMVRTAVVAWFLSRFKWHCNYSIIEHSSRFLTGESGKGSRIRETIARFVARKAQHLLCVSQYLLDSMRNQGVVCDDMRVVGNIVDDSFYSDSGSNRSSDERHRLIHITSFQPVKRDKELLLSIAQLAERRDDFHLLMIGGGPLCEECRTMVAEDERLRRVVDFAGVLTPSEVALALHQSDIYIHSSIVETDCIAVSEALASGLPVVTTEAGAVQYKITAETGRVVKNIGELVEATDWMLDHYHEYDAEKIRTAALKYRCDTIGKELDETLT